MPNLAQTPPPALQAMAARVAELEKVGARILAEAADMREAVRRAEAATGVRLLPARPRLYALPPPA